MPLMDKRGGENVRLGQGRGVIHKMGLTTKDAGFLIVGVDVEVLVQAAGAVVILQAISD